MRSWSRELPNAVCERCGSIRIVRRRSSPIDRIVTLFTGRRPYYCKRCAWRGRRLWREGDMPRALVHERSALSQNLDAALSAPIDVIQDDLDFGRLNETLSSSSASDLSPSLPTAPSRRSGRGRRARRQDRRRQIIGALALAAGAILLFLIFATGSCGGIEPVI